MIIKMISLYWAPQPHRAKLVLYLTQNNSACNDTHNGSSIWIKKAFTYQYISLGTICFRPASIFSNLVQYWALPPNLLGLIELLHTVLQGTEDAHYSLRGAGLGESQKIL